MAIDFEGWEMEHTLITEYGWSLVSWKDNKELTENGHRIVEEHRMYQNHNFVLGNRDVRATYYAVFRDI